MGLINRFLLFVYALAIALLSIIVAVVFLGLLPEPLWLNEVRYALRQWQSMAVIGVFFLFSLYFLCWSLGRGSHGGERMDDVVVQGVAGEVSISLEAINKLLERVARQINGVRDAKVVSRPLASAEGNALEINLQLLVNQGHNVSGVADGVHAAIKREVSHTFGMNNADINIKVQEISNAPLPKGKRVV